LLRCVKVDILGRLCDNDLGRLHNHFTTTNVYLIGAAYNSYFLIIYKPSSLIISPQTFSMQLEAGTAWFCLFQCAIPFCTLSPRIDLSDKLGRDGKLNSNERKRYIDNNLCLYCGSKDHKVDGCPRKQPVRARLTTLEEQKTPLSENPLEN